MGRSRKSRIRLDDINENAVCDSRPCCRCAADRSLAARRGRCGTLSQARIFLFLFSICQFFRDRGRNRNRYIERSSHSKLVYSWRGSKLEILALLLAATIHDVEVQNAAVVSNAPATNTTNTAAPAKTMTAPQQLFRSAFFLLPLYPPRTRFIEICFEHAHINMIEISH